jgi:hypothetical protein
MLTNRVLFGFLLFLLLLAVWEFGLRPVYSPRPLVEEQPR